MRSRELRAIEEARADEARRAREVAALTAVLSGRAPRVERAGFNPRTLRNEVEGVFREFGARVFREERGG